MKAFIDTFTYRGMKMKNLKYFFIAVVAIFAILGLVDTLKAEKLTTEQIQAIWPEYDQDNPLHKSVAERCADCAFCCPEGAEVCIARHLKGQHPMCPKYCTNPPAGPPCPVPAEDDLTCGGKNADYLSMLSLMEQAKNTYPNGEDSPSCFQRCDSCHHAGKCPNQKEPCGQIDCWNNCTHNRHPVCCHGCGTGHSKVDN